MPMHPICNLSDLTWTALNGETAIANGNYPASTAYIDTTGKAVFGFLIAVGSLDSELTFQVKQDTAATETASKNVSGASQVVAATDDDKVFIIQVETSALDAAGGFKYVTLAASGAAGSNDYAAIAYFSAATVTAGTGGKGDIVTVTV